MIGLIMRGALGIDQGPGLLTCILAPLVIFVTVCCLCKASSLKLRHCCCIKRCLRAIGSDEFDDFDVTILVHEVMCGKATDFYGAIRIRAGDQVVQTDESKTGRFQNAVSILVEQGTEFLEIEFIDTYNNKVMALLKLEANQVHNPKESIHQKTYIMKQKGKGIVNPRIKISVINESDEEASLFEGMGAQSMAMSNETRVLLAKTAKSKDEGEDAPKSELEMLCKVCAGPVETFGSWGGVSSKYLNVVGPPQQKKYELCVWDSLSDSQKPGATPTKQVPMLRITGVNADPTQGDIFRIQYVDNEKVPKRLVIRRVDRSRDAWTELIQSIVTLVREQKSDKRQKRMSGSTERKKSKSPRTPPKTPR